MRTIKAVKRIRTTLALAIGLSTVWAAQADMRYQVDPAGSTVKWHGAKLGTDHFGKIQLKRGWLTLEGNRLTGGEFVVDMTSITNDDLSTKRGFFGGRSPNEKLLDHLKSDDFFAVKKFPESKFVIKQSAVGQAGDYEITGDITIRGITQPVRFTASVTVDGKRLTAHGKLKFNRAKHDVKFNSGSFSTRLGDKLIYDEVPLEVQLEARAD